MKHRAYGTPSDCAPLDADIHSEDNTTPMKKPPKSTKSDFSIFHSDVRNRLQTNGVSKTKQDVLKQGEYDTTDKILPLLPSQPTTTLLASKDSSVLEPHGVEFLNDSRTIFDELGATYNPPIIIEHITIDFPNLATYLEIELLPDTNYNNMSPMELETSVKRVYEEMVIWKKNIFLLPSGAAGISFISLITEWLGNINNNTSFKGISWVVIMILPNLLHQKPSAKSKAKEHSQLPNERLQMWNDVEMCKTRDLK